jgi:hypothetical protein
VIKKANAAGRLESTKHDTKPAKIDEQQVNRYVQLPGTTKTAGQMGADGATISTFSDGTKMITIWIGHAQALYRYSWKVDAAGNYISNSGCSIHGAERFFHTSFMEKRKSA